MPQPFLCTKETPWAPGLPTPVIHDETEEVGEQQNGWPGGDIITLRCKNCGKTWKEELSQ
jgi:hypothetical protein